LVLDRSPSARQPRLFSAGSTPTAGSRSTIVGMPPTNKTAGSRSCGCTATWVHNVRASMRCSPTAPRHGLRDPCTLTTETLPIALVAGSVPCLLCTGPRVPTRSTRFPKGARRVAATTSIRSTGGPTWRALGGSRNARFFNNRARIAADRRRTGARPLSFPNLTVPWPNPADRRSEPSGRRAVDLTMMTNCPRYS